MSDLLDELKKQTTTVSILTPKMDETTNETETEVESDDFNIPLEGEEPTEEDKHALDDIFEDLDEAADLFIHVVDLANQKVSNVAAQWSFFDSKDVAIMDSIVSKKRSNPKFDEGDFTPEEKEYSNKYMKYKELIEGTPFTEKTKKALRKPVMKQIEKLKYLRFTPGQAIGLIIGMNNIPLLMEIVPRALGKLKNVVSNGGKSK